jgi:hypothetical protein
MTNKKGALFGTAEGGAFQIASATSSISVRGRALSNRQRDDVDLHQHIAGQAGGGDG